MQDNTKSISKYLSKQFDNDTELNPKRTNNSQKMLKNTMQSCKTFAKVGLAISISTISVLCGGQPEKAQAAKTPTRVNERISENYQSKPKKQDSLDNKLSILKQNPLNRLNITQNIYKNISAQLPLAKLDRQIKPGKEKSQNNTRTIINSYEQSPSLLGQQNWSYPQKLASNEQLPTLPQATSKEYIFKIPALETNATQPNRVTEENSPSLVAQNALTQVYIVKPGDTLNTIAQSHQITRQQLIESNKIQNPNLIFVSQRLRIPQINPQQNNFSTIVTQNNQPSLKPQVSGLDNSVTENTEETIANPLGMTIKLSASIAPKLPPLSSPEQYLPASPAEFDGYIWPARGTFTSGFGWRWGRPHKGIDIAAPIGTPIMAAASGEVIFAGWNSGGYGNLVKLKHPNGSVTFYAHNHRIMVRRGQKVEQGQQIAQMGSTGFSTGSHLHFEIRPNGQAAANPIAYLPKK